MCSESSCKPKHMLRKTFKRTMHQQKLAEAHKGYCTFVSSADSTDRTSAIPAESADDAALPILPSPIAPHSLHALACTVHGARSWRMRCPDCCVGPTTHNLQQSATPSLLSSVWIAARRSRAGIHFALHSYCDILRFYVLPVPGGHGQVDSSG